MNIEAAQILDSEKAQAPAASPNTTVEAPKPEAQHPADERVSSKLEILIRREAAAMERERLAKQRESELEEKLKRIQEFEGVKSNPSEALKMLGLSYDELTQAQLKDGEIPPQVEIRKLRDELERYKNENKAEKDQMAEQAKAAKAEAEQRAISEFKTEIGSYIKENVQRYELIGFENADELVFDLIDENYNRTIDPETGMGKVMSIAEACDKVEAFLEKKYADSRGLNKVKQLWQSIPKATQDKLIEQAKTNKPAPRTLTNNLASAVSHKSSRPPEDQRIKQIVENFRATKGL